MGSNQAKVVLLRIAIVALKRGTLVVDGFVTVVQ